MQRHKSATKKCANNEVFERDHAVPDVEKERAPFELDTKDGSLWGTVVGVRYMCQSEPT